MKLMLSPGLDELIFPQQRAIEKWARRRLGRLVHERRVRHIASRLFDLTWKLHRLRQSDRRLLGLAAMVHDVGRCIDDKTHPRQGAKLLARAKHLSISHRQRRALIYLTRYHRGVVPSEEMDKVLRETDRLKPMRVLLALLRAADGLDSRTRQPPQLVISLHGRQLHIICYCDEADPEIEKVFGRRKKFKLLEEMLDCRVNFQIVAAQALQWVG